MDKYIRMALLLILDIVVINVAYIIALLLRFEFAISSNAFNSYFEIYADNIVFITVASVIGFALSGLYTSIWKYAGSDELIKLAIGALLAESFTIVYLQMTQQLLPRSTYIIAGMIVFLGIGFTRMSYRYMRRMKRSGLLPTKLSLTNGVLVGKDMTKVMIVGAGDAGAKIIEEIRDNPDCGKKVVVAIDDDPRKLGRRISGVKVVGDRTKIRVYARKFGISEIVVTMPSASKKDIQEILTECNKTKCKVKILPFLIDLIDDKISISKLRDVAVEDLLGREPVKVNLREVSGYIDGKIVLISGAGGSIGSELCRQVARFNPRRIIALDIYENGVFELCNEIKSTYPSLDLEVVIASVRSKERLDEVFEKYKPHVVFHAAAHKHVPLMEANPGEALKNNILGTKNIVDISDKHLVERFVMISTDKAVNPTNVMGATKRVCEMIVQEKDRHSKTNYVAVRFGNVLGSNGSVIPIFKKQIEKGGPVTVTHPDITRYFMTIPEAAQLVIQAGAMARGGEIFILDMGEPVKIIDLAENLIRLSGYNPETDIEIKITGLRPGEKLYEELLLEEEGIKKTGHDKIYVGQPLKLESKLQNMLEKDTLDDEINKVAQTSKENIKTWLKEIVKTYNPQ